VLDKLKDQRLIFIILVLMIISQTIITLHTSREAANDVLRAASIASENCQQVSQSLKALETP
jgi:hypothetical protein